MFNNTFRSYVSITKQFYPIVVAYSTQYNCIKSRFTFSTRKHCVKNYVLTTQNCSTFCNRSTLVNSEYNKKYEQKLEELLKDPEYQQLHSRLNLEIEFLRHSNARIPEKFVAYDWLMLFSTKSRAQRRGYLSYRWLSEIKEKSVKEQKELKQIELQKRRDLYNETECDHIRYGLHKNTMFLRIYEGAMTNFYNSRLISAMLYEPTVVFDLGYDENMSVFDAQNCARQLTLSFALNRVHAQPFNLYFCNANTASFTMQKVHTAIPTLYDPEFPLNITSQSYTDLFDKDRLVYLSPHAHYVMEKYDPNLIYIIGGLVDKTLPEPVSLTKAKKNRIKAVKLPLHYLDWGSGSAKSLTLNQVLSILLDIRHTNDWMKALQHIPQRKLKPYREFHLNKTISVRRQIIDTLMENK